MIYILIVVMFAHSVAMQEFNSLQACQHAQVRIEAMKAYVATACLPKGEK